MTAVAENADELVDAFVSYLNGAGFEPKFPDQLPEELRTSIGDYGTFKWQIQPATSNPWVEAAVEKAPSRLAETV